MITIVGIYNKALAFYQLVVLVNIYVDGACRFVGHRDDVEACAIEDKACFTVVVIIYGCLLGRAHGEGGHVQVDRVITIDVVGIGQGVLAGAVLVLDTINGRTFLTPNPLVIGHIDLCPAVAPGKALQFNKAILEVNGGCRNYGDGIIVVAGIGFTGILDRIGKLLIAVHLHTVKLVAHSAGSNINSSSTISAVVGGCHSAGNVAVCVLLIESIVQDGVIALQVQTFAVRTNSMELTIFTKHIVGQNVDIHRQAEVDYDGIGQCLTLPHYSKPNNGMGIVNAAVFLDRCLVAVSSSIIRVVLGNVSGRSGSTRATLGGSNLPVTTSAGGYLNFINSTGCSPVNRDLIIQLIAFRQNTQGSNIDRFNGRTVRIQQNGLIDYRIGNRDLVSEGAGCTGGLVNNNVTIFVHQVEGVGNDCFLPCHNGRSGLLQARITQEVIVIQDCKLVSLVGAAFLGTFHSAIQVDVVAHGELGGLDSTQLPVEGLLGELVGRTGGQTMLVLTGRDVHTFNGYIQSGRVVDERLCVNKTIGVQDIVGRIADGIGTIGIDGYTKGAVLIHVDQVGVGLTIGIEYNHFQQGLGALAVTDHVFRNRNTINHGANFIPGVNIVGENLDRGIHSCAIGAGKGLHLQVEAVSNLIHKAGIGGSIGNLSTDNAKCRSKLISGFNLVIVLGRAGLRRSQGRNSLINVFCGNVSILLGIKIDSEHLCTQTGHHIHILFAVYRGKCSVRKTCGILTNDLIRAVGITLNSICHAVLIAHTIAIVVFKIIVITMRCRIDVACSKVAFCPSTGNPTVPFIITIL